MAIKNIRTEKSKKAITDLLTRQDYLITQGNDLAKSFGNLKAFEHRVLDYCFSFVQKDDKPEQEYEVSTLDIIRNLNLNKSGDSYERVALALKGLNEKTAMYSPVTEDGQEGIMMYQLFSNIKFMKNGKTKFTFSKEAAPYVFELVGNYYSFKLSELSRIKSKYGLILLKLWESKRISPKTETTIKGTLSEWEDWFLGDNDKLKKSWSAGRFKQQCILTALKSLSKNFPKVDFYLETIYDHRKTVGFELTINGTPHGKGSKL